MTYEMIKAMLVFWLDVGTIVCLFLGGKIEPIKVVKEE